VKVTAALRVLGKFAPDEVSRVLGGAPTRVIARDAGSRLPNEWILTANVDPSQPLAEHIEWLLKQLEPRAARLKELERAGHHLGISAGVYVDQDRGMVLSHPPELLARVGALGLNLDIDLYPFSPDTAEPG